MEFMIYESDTPALDVWSELGTIAIAGSQDAFSNGLNGGFGLSFITSFITSFFEIGLFGQTLKSIVSKGLTN